MKRQIIKINEKLCNGCGLCVKACHEGAIALIDGKARLTRDDYCDGLGDCLPACPTGAITFETREAEAYNQEAVKKHLVNKQSDSNTTINSMPCGCPSTEAKVFDRRNERIEDSVVLAKSELKQFPIQIQLVPKSAPYFNNADVLIAADCTAFAYGDFHSKFIKGKITLIGCPKLDNTDYSIKLSEILISNDIKSITIIRMEVPCCGGIVEAVKTAITKSGKMIPWSIVTITRDGNLL